MKICLNIKFKQLNFKLAIFEIYGIQSGFSIESYRIIFTSSIIHEGPLSRKCTVCSTM